MIRNKNNQFSMLLFVCLLTFASCGKDNNEPDAYGNFESEEVIVSSQSQGIITSLNVSEGQKVEKDKLLGIVDTTNTTIKKLQLFAQKKVIAAKLQNVDAQLKVQDEQRANIEREVNRIASLLEDKAATQQQYDDILGKLKVLDSQTEAIKSQKNIIEGEQSVLLAQIAEVQDLLSKCRIKSPISGTILEKYVDEGELVTPGKALFKVADINIMELKVYVSGSQLSSIAIGDSVTVMVDGKDETMQKLNGIVSWVSSQVEFTPKIIQTREERVNMVYAVKIRVNNDGRLKIGMPGEVIFLHKL